ncbi:hypothetical protein [Endozoicomonas elysicola]|uniref:Uncharacterized protein n=1 Tax=Endozoicomonas elysicola TaxID=305900 RepID=A0A081KAW1_9GAMM|nr:hypothetical protein [Endozoicomonas elysicola]KEI71287.1 hypothetical protein GV64_11545 [Endozoicomonas elysicola]
MPEPRVKMRLSPVPESPECSYSSESRVGSETPAAIKKLGKRAKPDLRVSIPESPIALKRARLNTCQLSLVSQEIRLSVRGQNTRTSAPIQLLDLSSSGYQFLPPSGSGHRLVQIMNIREGDNFVSRYVIKITNASSKQLIERYHDDLTLITFQQAWTDYVACKCFGKKVKDCFPEQVIVPETRIVCMSYRDLTTIYGETLSKNSGYHFISKHKDTADELCVFAVIQEYIEMTSFSEADKEKYKAIMDFFKDQIKDSGHAKITDESANLKLDVNTQKPVFFDVEFNQLLDIDILHEFAEHEQNISEGKLVKWPLFSEAFDPVPGLIYKKIGLPSKWSLGSSFDKISLSESTTDVKYTTSSDVESGSDSEVFDHKAPI